MPSSWKPPEKSDCSTPSAARRPEAWLCLLAAAAEGGSGWLQSLKHAGSADRLLGLDFATLRRTGLDRKALASLATAAPPPRWCDWLAAAGHSLAGFGTEHYPERLAEIPDAPLALWIDGDEVAALGTPQLAVVGSRHPTRNGEITAESFSRELGNAGIVVTSGLAMGIDAASHRGGLDGIAGTIAVQGTGIDGIYPAGNRALAGRIREHGLIVSEYPPGHPVRAYQFPRRNRIIAALSLGTLVVEASRRSGSLITARLAADYGREVFTVPGSIHNPMSKGCHQLLRDGAILVESTQDILVEIAPQLAAPPADDAGDFVRSDSGSLPPELANCLDFSPISFDQLAQVSGLTTAELSSMLLHLEIQGKIEALPGGRYCRLAERSG